MRGLFIGEQVSQQQRFTALIEQRVTQVHSYLFNLQGIDILPATNNHVLVATDDAQVAILIKGCHVACSHPAVLGESFLCLRLVIVVPLALHACHQLTTNKTMYIAYAYILYTYVCVAVEREGRGGGVLTGLKCEWHCSTNLHGQVTACVQLARHITWKHCICDRIHHARLYPTSDRPKNKPPMTVDARVTKMQRRRGKGKSGGGGGRKDRKGRRERR